MDFCPHGAPSGVGAAPQPVFLCGVPGWEKIPSLTMGYLSLLLLLKPGAERGTAARGRLAGGPRAFGGDAEMASACPAGLNPGLPSPLVGWEDNAASSEPRLALKPPMHQLQPFRICYARH